MEFIWFSSVVVLLEYLSQKLHRWIDFVVWTQNVCCWVWLNVVQHVPRVWLWTVVMHWLGCRVVFCAMHFGRYVVSLITFSQACTYSIQLSTSHSPVSMWFSSVSQKFRFLRTLWYQCQSWRKWSSIAVLTSYSVNQDRMSSSEWFSLVLISASSSLQYFDTVGWMMRRPSGP